MSEDRGEMHLVFQPEGRYFLIKQCFHSWWIIKGKADDENNNCGANLSLPKRRKPLYDASIPGTQKKAWRLFLQLLPAVSLFFVSGEKRPRSDKPISHPGRRRAVWDRLIESGDVVQGCFPYFECQARLRHFAVVDGLLVFTLFLFDLYVEEGPEY